MKSIENKGLIDSRTHQETYFGPVCNFGTICIKLIIYKSKSEKSFKE